MSRIAPFNLRLSSATLKCPVSGTSVYFFRDQLKQQLSLQHAIELTSQALKWRVLQSKPYFNRTIQHGLLPMATRLRCNWQLQNQLMQSQTFYHDKWFCIPSLMQTLNHADGGQKTEAENTSPGSHDYETMINAKNYLGPDGKSQVLNLCEVSYIGHKYESKLPYIIDINLVYRILKFCNPESKETVFVPCESKSWQPSTGFLPNPGYNNDPLQRPKKEDVFGLKYFTSRLCNGSVFSLFCNVLIAKGKLKQSPVNRLGHKFLKNRSNLKTLETRANGYDHSSKVALTYQADNSVLSGKQQNDKNSVIRLGVQAKDHYIMDVSKFKFILGHSFNQKPNLNLFSFEAGRFAGMAKQKGSRYQTGFLTGYMGMLPTSILKAHLVKKTCVPCFGFGLTKAHGEFRNIHSLNTYVNVRFKMPFENGSQGEKHLTSDLSLRL